MNLKVARANPIRFAFCGALGISCLEAALTPWTEIQLAAEAAYDRTSACRFTSFVGYEWTGTRRSNNLHRNVIFRNDRTRPAAHQLLRGVPARGAVAGASDAVHRRAATAVTPS